MYGSLPLSLFCFSLFLFSFSVSVCFSSARALYLYRRRIKLWQFIRLPVRLRKTKPNIVTLIITAAASDSVDRRAASACVGFSRARDSYTGSHETSSRRSRRICSDNTVYLTLGQRSSRVSDSRGITLTVRAGRRAVRINLGYRQKRTRRSGSRGVSPVWIFLALYDFFFFKDTSRTAFRVVKITGHKNNE